MNAKRRKFWELVFERAAGWEAGPLEYRLDDPRLYAELIDKVDAGCPVMMLASAAIAFIVRFRAPLPREGLAEGLEAAGRRIDAEPVLAARLRRNFVCSLRRAQAAYAHSHDPRWIGAIAAVSVWRLRQVPDDVARCYLRSAN